MAEINEPVWLNARPEEAWPYIVEPENLMQWLMEMHKFEWLDKGPIGVGSRYYVDKEIRGQVRRYDSEVKQLQKNGLFAFTSEAPGFSRIEGVWELVPEGEGCRFTMREEINVQKANWLVDKLFVQPSAARAVRGFQAQLKNLVESSVTQ